MFETITHTGSGATAHRAATVQGASFSDADNSVEVTWTTGAPVRRHGFFSGGYIETLEVSRAAIRLDRLNAGASVLDSHDQFQLSSLLGSVVPGSARIEQGEGRCRIRLADTPNNADTIAKIKAGHLRSVSVGYLVHTYERHPSDTDEPDELRAIDWEPLEISLVSVPADPGATLRLKETDMTRIVEASAHRGAPLNANRGGVEPPVARGDRAPAREDEDDPARAAPRGPRGRGVTVARIRELCGRTDDLSRSFERDLLADHDEEPLSERELLARISDELVIVRSRPSIDARDGRIGTRNRGQDTRQHFADALYARLTGTEPPEAAREYRSAGLVDIARHMLEEGGERVRWMRGGQVIDQISRAGAHTTSDFQYVISSAASRYLMDAFTAQGSPLRAVARKRNLPDFKMHYGVQAEGPGALRAVRENAEIKRTSIREGQNGYRLSTYAEIFAISRQALINDDLGAFVDMSLFWARAAAETEASYLTAMISGNGAVMQDDGKTLYHADHRNIAAAAPIMVVSLSEARQLLRAQKNRDGVTLANVTPKYLVVGPAKETEAEMVLAELAATSPANVNPFAGKLELVVDPRLPGNSWRLFADPALNPVLEYANLEGQEGLFTDSRIGFDIDGVEFKARIDLGAGAMDYRGTMMNPGA